MSELLDVTKCIDKLAEEVQLLAAFRMLPKERQLIAIRLIEALKCERESRVQAAIGQERPWTCDDTTAATSLIPTSSVSEQAGLLMTAPPPARLRHGMVLAMSCDRWPMTQ